MTSMSSERLATEIAKTEAAIERYMTAFERGTLPDEAFADRVRELGLTTKTLRARRTELAEALPSSSDTLPSPAVLAAIHRELEHVAEHAPDDIKKTVARAFVKSLEVESATRVRPVYRVLSPPPDAWPDTLDRDLTEGEGVRTTTSVVGAEGLEPPTSAV